MSQKMSTLAQLLTATLSVVVNCITSLFTLLTAEGEALYWETFGGLQVGKQEELE